MVAVLPEEKVRGGGLRIILPAASPELHFHARVSQTRHRAVSAATSYILHGGSEPRSAYAFFINRREILSELI